MRIEETEFDFAQYTQFLADNAADIADFRTKQTEAFTREVAHWHEAESAAVEAAATRLAAEGVWLVNRVVDTAWPGESMVEIVVGAATMAWTPAEAAAALGRLAG